MEFKCLYKIPIIKSEEAPKNPPLNQHKWKWV